MRKFTLATIAIVCLQFMATAQITKGSTFIGGSFNFSHFTQDATNTQPEGKQTGVSISPAIGKVVKDNLVVGVTASYGSFEADKYFNYTDQHNRNWGAGVFVRRYVPIVNRLLFFTESDLGYSHQNSKYSSGIDNGYNNTMNAITAGVSPGLTFRASRIFYLELGLNNLIQLGYSSTDNMQTTIAGTYKTTQKGFFLSGNLTNNTLFNIGLRFILPKTK